MAASFMRCSCVFITTLCLITNGSIIQRFPPEVSETFSEHARSTTTDELRRQFNRMAIDPVTRSVYVGAVNRLYQLDPDRLTVVGARSLGPRLDDRRCTESFGNERCDAGGSTSYGARPTDTHVKILSVDVTRRHLIVCGSTFQGTCELIPVNLGVRGGHGDSSSTHLSGDDGAFASSRPTRGNTDYFAAANDPYLSTVGFVAPGPSRHPVLYVAATYSGTASVRTTTSTSSDTSGSGSPSTSSSSSSSSAAVAAAVSAVRQAVPAVSSRSLVSGPGAFRFVHVDGLTGGTAVRFRSEAIERFPVKYVSGFDGYDGFSYFVAVQPDSFEMSASGILPPTVSTRVGSRIIQVSKSFIFTD